MFFRGDYLKNGYSNLELSFKKKINSLDRKMFEYIFSDFFMKKSEFIEISLVQLSEILGINSEEEIFKFFQKLTEKKMNYSLVLEKVKKVTGEFSVITSYIFYDKIVTITLSPEVKSAFTKSSFFNTINLLGILKFKNSYSLSIYLKILNLGKLDETGYLTFQMEELKEMLKMDSLYSRFYDLERKVLNPIVEDINSNTDYNINITRIKSGTAKSCKILGIKIEYVNRSLQEIRTNANTLMNIIKDNVKDFNFVYKILTASLKEFGYGYVEKNVKFSLINSKKEIFDSFLQRALIEDLEGVHSLSINHNKISVEKTIYSPNMLYEELNNIFNQMGLKEASEDVNFHSLFYRTMYQFKENKKYEIEYNFYNSVIKILFQYRISKKSLISVEKVE